MIKLIPFTQPVGKVEFYFDEAGKSRDETYLAVGGTFISVENRELIEQKLFAWKLANGLIGELKWNKVKATTLKRYKLIVDAYVGQIAAQQFEFHLTFADMQAFQHENRDSSLSLQRIYYLLFKYRSCRRYGLQSEINIFFDRSDETSALENKNVLLKSANRHLHKKSHNLSISIKGIDSKDSLILQLNDIILGGLTFLKNSRQNSTSTPDSAKHELASYIAQKLEFNSLDDDVNAFAGRVSIWNFRTNNNPNRAAKTGTG